MKKWFFGENQNISRRLDELDARLLRRDDVASLLQAGKKINAIKIYREDTGASLADAKAAIERMEQQLKLYGLQFSSIQVENAASEAHALRSEVDLETLLAEVGYLLSQNEKIKAIKRYREITGVGLREAKEAVDQMDVNLRGNISPVFRAPTPGGQETVPGLNRDTPDEEVRRHLLAGNKILAIKAYRAQTGLPLKEAKDEIDRLERSLLSDPGL